MSTYYDEVAGKLRYGGYLRVEFPGTQTNINATLFATTTTQVVLDAATFFNTISGASLAGNVLTLPAGTYEAVFNVNLTSNNTRTNVGWKLRDVTGAAIILQEFFGKNYLRLLEGHNEAADCWQTLINLPTETDIDVVGGRMASAGTVSIPSGMFYLKYLTSRVTAF